MSLILWNKGAVKLEYQNHWSAIASMNSVLSMKLSRVSRRGAVVVNLRLLGLGTASGIALQPRLCHTRVTSFANHFHIIHDCGLFQASIHLRFDCRVHSSLESLSPSTDSITVLRTSSGIETSFYHYALSCASQSKSGFHLKKPSSRLS
jgi:hypothetical protein